MARDKTSLDHYSPIHPTKRMKIKRVSGRVERYDPYAEQNNDTGAHIHPSRNTNFRPHSTSRPNGLRRHGRKPPKGSRANTTMPSDDTTSTSLTTHTKKERTSNPSTRIASLRKLLAHPTATTNLPPGARIEKERELAGLIFEQQKEKLARNRAAMIGRYHRVRFFERKKAERKLKRVIKERDGVVGGGVVGMGLGFGVGVEGDPEGEEERMRREKERDRKLRMLNAQVRNARVDLAYTIFSPLTEKYIGLFADDPGDEKFKLKIENHKKDLAEGLSERDAKLLSEEQKEQLQGIREQEMQVVRMADMTGSVKPPGWYVVQAIMYPNRKFKHRTHTNNQNNANTKQQGTNLDGAQEPDVGSITNEFFFYDDGTEQDKDDTEDPLKKAHIKKHLDLLRESRLSSSKDADGDTVVTGESRADVELRRFGAVSLHARGDEAMAFGPSRTGNGGKHGNANASTSTNVSRSRKRARPTWLDEDEDALDPDELDSSSSQDGFEDENDDDDDDGGGVKINQNRGGDTVSASESESDGAGGFFER